MLPAHLQSHLRQAAAAPRSGLHPQDNHWQASTNCDPTYHIAFQPLYFCLGRSAASLSLTWPGDHPPDSTAQGEEREKKTRRGKETATSRRVGLVHHLRAPRPVQCCHLPCPALRRVCVFLLCQARPLGSRSAGQASFQQHPPGHLLPLPHRQHTAAATRARHNS